MRVLCADIECDGLLSKLTKLHCFVARDSKTGKFYKFTDLESTQKFLDKAKKIPLVMHNGVTFDKPALEKLGLKVQNPIIDTLPLSWYLFPEKNVHGLDAWGNELGIPKPPIDDWENLSIEEYLHRCTEDVKIQTLLWDKVYTLLQYVYREGRPHNNTSKGIKEIIYDGEVNHKKLNSFLKYISFKMELLAVQEKFKWKLNVKECDSLRSILETQKDLQTEELVKVMPEVKKFTKKSPPKVMYKKNGELSANGVRWLENLRELELPDTHKEEINVLKEMVPPNPNSAVQKKDWLFSLGWEPETFKYVRDKKVGENGKPSFDVRKIPQITSGEGELCPSIIRLAKIKPELKHLEGLGILQHRLGIVNGFLRDVDEDGYLVAGASGLTNTLRMKHRTLVNIPSSRAQWGKEIRSLLICEDSEVLCGSDLSSLEDRLKHHFQVPIDPDYVKSQMSEGFDPHLLMCVQAGLVNEDDSEKYKALKKEDKENLSKEDKAFLDEVSKIRHSGKGANYACQYGAKGPTIARSAGVEESVGELLYNAYWELNWSIEQIAKEMEVKEVLGGKYQRNPLNGFWYRLKTEKDRFSTLIQGSGSYIFDLWAMFAMQIAKEEYKAELKLIGQFHDELIIRIKDSERGRELAEKVLRDAIHKVNERLKLNRDMDIDVQFGKDYSEIH